MQKSNDDCFYFLTSSCTKGMTCPYRHNPSVIICNVTCPAWSRGNCSDPVCSLRHNNVQRPFASNGMVCFYEKTPMGCLKPDCTFFHARSRPNLRNVATVRPATTNLVNKEAMKLPVASPNSTPTTNNESVAKVEIPSNSERVAPGPEATTDKLEAPIPSFNTGVSERNQTETTKLNNNMQSRLVGNRNVVVADSSSTSTRTIVHAASNRVVVSSETRKCSSQKQNKTRMDDDDDDSDIDLEDLIGQENDINNCNTPIDILFPCSAPSMAGRLFMSTKQAMPTSANNDTKPIRLIRDRLPATKLTSGNSSNSVSTLSNENKTTAGTELLYDNQRLNNRLERFKNKPNSPPRTIVSTSTPTHTGSSRDVITSSSHERKRSAVQQSLSDSPPFKRSSATSQQENTSHSNSATIGDLCSPPSSSRRSHTHHHRRRSSPQRLPSPRPTSSSLNLSIPSYSSSSTMNESDWKKEVDRFLAKTAQPKKLVPTSIVSPQPVPLLSLRPRYMPPQQPMICHRPPPPRPGFNRMPRPRQPTSVFFKRPSAPVASIPPTPIESLPVPPPPSSPIIVEKTFPAALSPSTKANIDEENKLLELDEPTYVVDTFALIDEALLDADDLLDLM